MKAALMSLLSMSLAGCVGVSSAPPSGVNPSPGGSAGGGASVSLREAAEPTKRKVGVAIATWFMGDPKYSEVAAREFDSLTAENEMKWYATEPRPGDFTFEAGDRLVEFAEKHTMRVRGHTLVWHNQLAPWVNGLKGNELRDAMLRHVTKPPFAGRVASSNGTW
jgi:endo-1,4-beta-xylanase